MINHDDCLRRIPCDKKNKKYTHEKRNRFMGYKIVWTFQVRKDLKCIKEYIQKDSHYYAEKLIAHLYEKADVLQDYPEIGIPVLPEKYKCLRKVLYQSYKIIYHFSDIQVTIITVHHQSRLIENIQAIKDYKE
jgi:plasmid stabilization system protein ParE